MAYDTLREFIDALDAADELVRVTRPVRVELEITEIADRCMKSPGGGPALLFETPVLPDGSISEIPLGINLFGSRRRMAIPGPSPESSRLKSVRFAKPFR